MFTVGFISVSPGWTPGWYCKKTLFKISKIENPKKYCEEACGLGLPGYKKGLVFFEIQADSHHDSSFPHPFEAHDFTDTVSNIQSLHEVYVYIPGSSKYLRFLPFG